ncbi:MAG: glycosyltransferase family 2 protein [Pseudomonadales bacterium]|nr:glycosyltransferase family 2 protein [Pseudomonadales bacterium]
MPEPATVAAIVVTYHPDQDFSKRLDALLAQLARLVIVDNGSDEACLSPLQPYLADDGRVTIHRNKTNLGIATALNQGFEILIAEGYRWVLTLDQDSISAAGMVAALCDRLADDPDPSTVAMIGARRRDSVDRNAQHWWMRPKSSFPFFERVACEKLDDRGTTLVITSGTLTSTAAFEKIGPFRDELFIDLVDIEYSLRARHAGYRIIGACSAHLVHRIGATRVRSVLGIPIVVTNHAPMRRYYIFRNSIVVICEYFRVHPHWLIYHCLALGQVVLGVLLFETRKLANLRASCLGVYDGIRRRLGPARHEF